MPSPLSPSVIMSARVASAPAAAPRRPAPAAPATAAPVATTTAPDLKYLAFFRSAVIEIYLFLIQVRRWYRSP